MDVVTNLWQLFSNISSNKHSLKVNPQVLHCQPVLNNVGCVRKLLNPALNLLLEGRIIPGKIMNINARAIRLQI